MGNIQDITKPQVLLHSFFMCSNVAPLSPELNGLKRQGISLSSLHKHIYSLFIQTVIYSTYRKYTVVDWRQDHHIQNGKNRQIHLALSKEILKSCQNDIVKFFYCGGVLPAPQQKWWKSYITNLIIQIISIVCLTLSFIIIVV